MGEEGKPSKRESDREAADLAALADGSLPADRRREVEARVAASPRLQLLLIEQRAALDAIRARDERAPQRLRDAVEGVPRTRRRPGLRLGAALGAAAAAAAAALVLIALPGSETAPPTLTQVAALGTRAPTVAHASGPRLEAWGLGYPDLRREYHWRQDGSRTDRLGGRTARTVFYAKDGRRIAYTILSIGSVKIPEGAHSWRRKGRPWYAFEEEGRTVLAWEREGHMCVVSAGGLRSRSLVRMITS
jgi:hypothetical protein